MRSMMLVAVVLLTVGCTEGLSGGLLVVLALVAGLTMACSQRVQARIEPEPSAAAPEVTVERAIPEPQVAEVEPEPAIAALAAPPVSVEPSSEPPSERVAEATPGSSAFERRVHDAVERLPVERRARIRQRVAVAVAANGGGEGFEHYCKIVLPRWRMRAMPRWVHECRIVFAEPRGEAEEGL